MAPAPAFGHRGRNLRNEGEHSGHREGGIRAYTALADQEKRTSVFTIDAFVYDPREDLYTCPAGETLRRRGHDHRGSYVRYAAKASACNECPAEEQVHKQSEWALGEPQSRRRIPRKGQSLPRHRSLPQGPEKTRRMGRAALRGGQGMARIEEVQAKGA